MRVFAAFAVASVSLVACGERDASTDPAEAAPRTARIVCDDDGTTLETPVVAARPDGVHIDVENHSSSDASFTFQYEGGGGGRSTKPNGVRRYVETFPPGRVSVGCLIFRSPSDVGEPDMKALTVTDPHGHFTSMKLDCVEAVHGSGGAPGAYSTDDRKELIEAVRDAWREDLRPGDVVEIGGYPRSPNGTYVRVVRDGRVVASATYLWDGGTWGDNGYSACSDF